MEEMILAQVNLQLELLRDTKLSTFGKSGAKFFSLVFAWFLLNFSKKVDFCSTFLKSGFFYTHMLLHPENLTVKKYVVLQLFVL
jgi:hypothetical protein